MTRTPDGRPTTAFPVDLAAVAAATLLAMVAALARADPWRAVLGWPLPLLLPGYALMAWLFPARAPAAAAAGPLPRALAPWERIGLGVATSIACTGLLGIALQFTPGAGITLATMAYGLGLLTALFLVLAVGARLRLPPEQRPQATLGAAPDPERPAGRTGRGMAVLLALSFAGMVLVLLLLFPKPAVDAYTNLYVLGDGGKAACLPDTYAPATGFATHPAGAATCPAATGHVTVGVVNHEAKVVTYYVRVFWSGPTPEPRGAPSAGRVEDFTIQLGPMPEVGAKPTFERQYERNVTLTAPPLPGLQRLNVQVYKDFGAGIPAVPDLFAYFYVQAP